MVTRHLGSKSKEVVVEEEQEVPSDKRTALKCVIWNTPNLRN